MIDLSPTRGWLLAGLLTLAPATAAAQATPGAAHRTEVALEAGVLAGGVSVARRAAGSPLSVGVGAWGAWEPPNSFDRNVWEPTGGVVFGRYRAAPWLHADVGVTAARYLWADDCSDCSGGFVGVRSAALVGYRNLFLGPELSLGRASDSEHGSDYGVLWGAQLRLMLGWD